jgi:3-hydroxybutyryl-CoA dehydratase
MNELGGYAFADLRVGMCATFTKTVTEADIVLFAAVRRTTTPFHTNEEFAAGTIFKGRIAHGMLSASVISAAIEGEALVALPAPRPPNISVRSRSKKRLPLLRRSSTEAAAGQFKVSHDTRRTGTASTTILRRGQ